MPRITPRFGLKAIDFLETSPDVIKSELIAEYQSTAGRTLADGDPVRLFLNAVAARMAQLAEAFNLAAKNNLLSYATGDYLDAMGYYVNTPRLQSSSASVTMRFSLAAPVEVSAYQIPKGTLVTDGSIVFSTDALAIINVGESSVDVTATATDPGSFANDLAIGTITQFNDPLPELSATNIDMSSGGADKEEDEAYAERIRLAPSSFSVAGPHGAYEYHTLKFSSSIVHASIYGLPEHPGNVYIHPLLEGGKLPEQAFLDQLKAYLSDENLRPLTDNLIVTAPEAVDYTIKITWYLSTADLDKIQQITAAVKQAVNDYKEWQQSRIGRDLIPDELTRRVVEAGAKRLSIESPVFTTVSSSQVAQCSNIEINFGGTEEA